MVNGLGRNVLLYHNNKHSFYTFEISLQKNGKMGEKRARDFFLISFFDNLKRWGLK